MRSTTAIKLAILALIIAVPFVKFSHVVLDTIAAKLIMLVVIAATSFYDMEIAILLTILFFLLIISSNDQLIKKAATATATAPASDAKKEPFVMTEFPDAGCPLPLGSQEDPNPYPFFVDEKVKPYEEYIKRIGVPSA
jgi:hypothetical protein